MFCSPLKWLYISFLCHNTSYNFVSFLGNILKNNETLLQYGVKPKDIVQVDIYSTLPELYPIKRLKRLSASQIIIVRIQTGQLFYVF